MVVIVQYSGYDAILLVILPVVRWYSYGLLSPTLDFAGTTYGAASACKTGRGR